MSYNVEITHENAKLKAKALQDRYRDLGIELKLGQAYEAIATISGFKNWHVMKVSLERSAAPDLGKKRATYPAVEVDIDNVVDWANNCLEEDSSFTRDDIVPLMSEFFSKRHAKDAAFYEDFFCDWLNDEAAEGRRFFSQDESLSSSNFVIDKDALFERWKDMAVAHGADADKKTLESVFITAISTPGHLSDEALDSFYNDWLEENWASSPAL